MLWIKFLDMEAIFDRDPSEAKKIFLCKAKADLDDRLLTEDFFWRRMANIMWIKEGEHKVFSIEENSTM